MSNFFGTVSHANTAIEAPVYEGYIEPTADAIMAIATEGVIEGLQVQAALHVADAAIAYTSVNESAGAAEVVLEGVIGNTVSKLKEGIKKLWAKIKAWFASVRKTFSLMFAKGKDFVKKYKKEIIEKPAGGFTYDGYVWTIEAGNTKVKALVRTINDKVKTTLDKATGMNIDDFVTNAKATDGSSAKSEFDLGDIKEDLMKQVGNDLGAGVDNMSEVKEKLQEIYRNGKDAAEEIKDFAKMSKGALIDIIDKSDKNQKDITDVEKEVDKTFNETIKALTKLESEIGKTKDGDFHGSDDAAKNKSRAAATAIASLCSNVTRYGQSLNSAIAGAAVENIKAAATEAESVLKRFIKHKAVKESFGGSGSEETHENVLEGFIASIKL